MLKKKNEAWRHQFRKLQRESMKRTIRDRHLLLTTLEDQLTHFQKCSLAGGAAEELDHSCYFHCEKFVGLTCHDLYRSIAAVGSEHCKGVLIARGLPGRLAMILDAVQNKTVVNEELEMSRQCFSRLQLEEAITKLLSLFTEDEELLQAFGDDAADLIFTALKFRDPHLTTEDGSLNLIHGLHNLFLYDSSKANAYSNLRGNNFEPLVWRHIMLIVDNRLVQSQVETSMLALTRIYLRFQQEETEDQPHKMVGNAVGHLVKHLFQPDNQQFLDGFDEEFQEELLRLIALFQFQKETALMVLRCMSLTQHLPYAELFNEWTYHLNITIRDFLEVEMSCLVGMEGVREGDRPRYEKLVAGVLANLVLNTADNLDAVAMIWRCLERTGSWEEWLDREDHPCFGQLRRLLNRTPPIYPL